MQVTPALVGVCSLPINTCALQVKKRPERAEGNRPTGIFLSEPSFSISTPTQPPYLLTQKENRTPQSTSQCGRRAVLVDFFFFFYNIS